MLRSGQLLFLLLLILGAHLAAQEGKNEEKTGEAAPTSAPAPAPVLEELKVPETSAAALDLQAKIQQKLDAIPADTTDKKELRASYDKQVQQLALLARELGALENFDARLEELRKEQKRLQEEQQELGEPREPSIPDSQVTKEALTEAQTVLDQFQRELGEVKTRLEQKGKDRQALAGAIEDLGTTIAAKTAELGKLETELAEARQKGGDLLLLEQRVFGAKLERAVFVQRKAVYEKEQTTGRRQVEETIEATRESLARRKLADQVRRKETIAGLLAERQENEGQYQLSRAIRSRDKYKPGEPWYVYWDLRRETIEAEQRKLTLIRSETDLAEELLKIGLDTNLLSEAQELKKYIDDARAGNENGYLPQGAAEIRDYRDAAQKRFEGAAVAWEKLQQALARVNMALKETTSAKIRVSRRVEEARTAGRVAASPDRSPPEQDWTKVENDLVTALGALETELNRQQTSIRERRDRWASIRKVANGNIAYLNESLLWTREESHITFESIEQAAGDAGDAVENTPTQLSRAWDVLEGHLVAKDRRTRLVVVGTIFLALGFLLWRVRKRLPTTYVWIEEQSKSGSQFFKVLGIYLRRTDLSLLVALLLVGAPLAAGMERTIVLVALCLFGTPFLYRLGRTTLDIFFQPGSNEVRFFDMDEELAQIVHRAGRWVLNLALFFLPAGYLMELSGYETRNPGFVELWWLVHGGLTQLVLLFSIFRPKVVRTLIRGQNIVAVSIKAWILLAYPLVVGGTIFVFLLGSLRYEAAQDYFQTIILKSLAVLVGGYVIYRVVLRAILRGQDVDQRLNPDEFESDDAYVAAGRKQFSGRLVRTVVRFGFAIPIVIVLSRFWEGLSLAWATTSLVGDSGIALVDIAEAVLVVFITTIVVTKVRGALSYLILPSTKLDRGLRYTVVMLTTYGLWTIGIVIALQLLQVKGEHIAVFTGALAFGIGFGLQSIVKNFISGLILLVERPVKVGDMVEVENRSGVVDKITLRATTVMAWDGIGVVIPNELMIGGSLTNYSLGHPRLRSTLAVGVAYGSDVQKVRKILNEVVANHGLVLKRPEPEVFFVGFGDSSLDFQVLFWTNITTHRPRTLSDLRFAVDAAFRREGIEIPFPQRDLHVRTVDGTVVGAFGGAKLPRPGDGGALDRGPAAPQGSSEKSSS